jgi:hypothetical protein
MSMGTGDGVVSASICVDVSPKRVQRSCSRSALNCLICSRTRCSVATVREFTRFSKSSYHPPHLVGVIPPTYEIEPDLAQSGSIHYIP